MITWLSKWLRPQKKKKVFVGISGGVDSSVSAALLKDQGYDVVGVFIRTWQPDWIECTWRNERRDAMRVCAHLTIPFVELDLEQEYKQGVADYMIAEYRVGRTPNPDVMCNREVKFGGFLKWALAQGADYVATGHYAQNINNQLHQGADPSKDQSYFLWTLTNEQLQHVLFPIGHLQKNQVRNLAEKYHLPTATKKDSQGICFIGEIDMKEFLKHYIDIHPGDVINEQGEIIGHHQGSLFYTIGERHGFTITKKGTHDLPYYVAQKDSEKNILIVSQHPFAQSVNHQVIINQCVFRETLDPQKKYFAQIRYHGNNMPCIIEQKNDTTATILFDEYDYSISPGQSIVVYDNQKCIGGGVVA